MNEVQTLPDSVSLHSRFKGMFGGCNILSQPAT